EGGGMHARGARLVDVLAPGVAQGLGCLGEGPTDRVRVLEGYSADRQRASVAVPGAVAEVEVGLQTDEVRKDLGPTPPGAARRGPGVEVPSQSPHGAGGVDHRAAP